MKTTIKIVSILSFFFGIGLVLLASSQSNFTHDMEVKINGLVCPSCAIGIKRNFKKFPTHINKIKFDTKKQLALISFHKSKDGRIYWLKNDQIIKLVKNAGYEVTSIKRLDNIKPNRYNKP